MCGIAGVISATPLSPLHHEQLLRMNGALMHRGPDGSGLYQGSHVALAMRRLSIIDLSNGWQPLYNEDKSLALIANGEIYNFVELRAELQRRGHSFRTGSDCEVILHLYEEYGEDCVHHLRGMFAFALWDERRRELFLARDRMGEKPLYLYEKEGLLYFASELKALLRTGVINFQLDPAAVYQYFHYQYVPEPSTPIKGVRKLAAAHRLTLSIRPWSVKEQAYWCMEDAPALEGDAAHIIRAELERVSELIIRSDVAVGVALSGGLDSGVIAALTAKTYSGRLTAFSVGYEGRPRYDERRDAKAMADHLSIPLQEVEIRTADMVHAFPELIFHADDPIADIASYGYYALMKAARKCGVPVMLLGQGGDELFWGYSWVTQALRQSIRKAGWQPEGRPQLMDYFNLTLPPVGSRRGLFDWFLSSAGARSSYQQYCRDRRNPGNRIVFFDQSPLFRTVGDSVQVLLTEGFRDSIYESELWKPFTLPHPWPRLDILFTKLICETYLIENGITQGDRLSMASSVELRLPFIDYRFVETVIGLRKTRPDHALPPKAWLKSAVKNLVPSWILNRPKRGFQPPSSQWSQGVRARYGRALEDGMLVQTGILKPEIARSMAYGSPRGGPLAMLAFSALTLEYWCTAHLGHLPASESGVSARHNESVQRC